MKTIIITKEGNETIGEVIEYENENQKEFLFKHFLQGANIIYTIDIDGFAYLQHKKEQRTTQKAESGLDYNFKTTKNN